MFVTKKRVSSFISLIAMISAANGLAAQRDGGVVNWAQGAWESLPPAPMRALISLASSPNPDGKAGANLSQWLDRQLPSRGRALYYGASALQPIVTLAKSVDNASWFNLPMDPLYISLSTLLGGNAAQTAIDNLFRPSDDAQRTAQYFRIMAPALASAALAYNRYGSPEAAIIGGALGGAAGLSTPGIYSLQGGLKKYWAPRWERFRYQNPQTARMLRTPEDIRSSVARSPLGMEAAHVFNAE